MSGRPITLEELLAGRDARAAFQAELLAHYPMPLVSFTVNLPGPVKLCPRSERVHRAGVAAVRDALAGHVAYWKARLPQSGPEAFFACDLPAETVKARLCALEERHPLGRLFDLDVLTAPGVQLSREALGLAHRRCLVCGGDGAACARSRAHPLPELLAAVDGLLDAWQEEERPDV